MNVEKLLGGLLSGGFGGGGRRSGASSMLGGMGIGKAQVGMGLLGVAFAAFEHYQQSQSQTQSSSAPQPSPPPPPSPAPAAGGQHFHAAPPPPPPHIVSAPAPMSEAQQRDQDLFLVLEVMISAAHADGRLDSDERASILERAMNLELSSDDRRRLMATLDQPTSISQLAARARPQIAADLYAAAVLAISVDTEAERQWLQSFSQQLGVSAADCAQIESRLAG